MSNLDKYRELRCKEILLRAQVINTQSEEIENERIRITLEREKLLFKMTEEELVLLRKEFQ